MSTNPPDVLVKAFDIWMDAQRKALEMICAVDQPGTGPDWAEGFRSVTRMASLALEHVVEKGDPASPVLFSSQNPWSKLIGDNPDTNYYFCTIDPQYDYRVWGVRGNAPYVGLTFGSDIFRGTAPKGLGTTGQGHLDQFERDADGHFELILSATEKPGNWIEIPPHTRHVAFRETIPDRSQVQPAEIHLERTSPEQPPELQPEVLAERLEAAANHLIWIFTAVTGSWKMSGQNLNVIVGAHGSQVVKAAQREVSTHSATDMYYQSGHWKLEKGQAWVVKILPPPNDYAYWGLVITNPWLESYDYFRTTTHLSNKTGVMNPDGSMTIVVAQEDPGVPNWLDCGSRLEGKALLRWTLAGDQVPDPECEVVTLEDVKAGRV